MLKHYLIVQCLFCEIVNVIRGISLYQRNLTKEWKCNQGCGSWRRTMLLIAQLLKCQFEFYMLQEKFWKINYYWWYYQFIDDITSLTHTFVAILLINEYFESNKIRPTIVFLQKSCFGDVFMSSCQKAVQCRWFYQSFTLFQHNKLLVFCRVTMVCFSLNNSFTRKVETKNSVHANVPYVIRNEI